MKYFVFGSDGNKYGPADLATLRTWMAEGRVQPDSWLEEEGTGHRVFAREVLAETAPPTPQSFAQPPPASPYPRPYESGDGGKTQFIIGWVCAAVSLFFCPIGFGIAAIALGVSAKSKGHPQGTVLIVCAAIMMVVGIAIGAIIAFNNPAIQDMFR